MQEIAFSRSGRNRDSSPETRSVNDTLKNHAIHAFSMKSQGKQRKVEIVTGRTMKRPRYFVQKHAKMKAVLILAILSGMYFPQLVSSSLCCSVLQG